jgi:Lysozyme like domain
MQLFGRGWKTLVPTLHEGALGMKELEGEAKAMGVTLGGNAQQNAIKMAQAQEKMKFASLGLQVAIAEKLAPALTELIGGFAEVVTEIRNGSGSIGHETKKISKFFEDAYHATQPVLEGLWKLVQGMAGEIKGAVEIIKGVLTLNFGEAWKGVKDIFSSGIKGATGLVEAAIAPFKHIGEALMHGLVEGIEAGAEWVKNAAEEVASVPSKIFNSVLSIKSPSKVFHAIGLNVAQGFADGLLAGRAAVEAGLHGALLSPVAAAAIHLKGHGAAMAHTASTGKLTKGQIERLWIEAGGSPSTANTAASIALAESGGNVSSAGDVGLGGSGPTSFGLWQIHTPAHPQYSASKLSTDPLYNARAAVAVSGDGTDFQPWTTYNTGAYRQFVGQSASVPAGTRAAKAKPTHWTPGPSERTAIASAQLGAAQAHRRVTALETDATGSGEQLSREQARWAVTPANMANPAQAGVALKHAEKALSSEKAKKHLYAMELKALGKEAHAWAKARDAYRKAARHLHDPNAKKEALNMAAGFKAKIEQAQAAAKALQGTIYSQETTIQEGEAAVAAVPGEAAAAQATQAVEVQGGDLSAYEAANTRIDAEVRAGRITADQGKTAKEANARKAEAGGYGSLSEEGLLKVQGDLKELSSAITESTSAFEAHTQAVLEATKAELEKAQAARRISEVESGTLLKALADMISGQIAGTTRAYSAVLSPTFDGAASY